MDTESDIMPKAIVIRAHGGPEVLQIEDVAVGEPAAGELRVRQTAIGVNFHDCYVRSGLYKTLVLPGIPGIEGAGIVEAVGPGVISFSPGDRIGYVTASYGSYAESRLLPAALAVKLPDDMPEETAAAVFVKGLTAAFLVLRTHRILPGQTILVHAAAGGVGQLLCQWASHLGATVIGTVGSSEKAALARKCGCAHTILYRQEDFLSRTKEITGGRGVDVAYDSVGRDTFAGSLGALALRGHIINFGQSSGPVASFSVSDLSARSNSLTRPILFHYITTRGELEALVDELFAALSSGILQVAEPCRFALAEAAEAHRALEARATSSSVLLIP
jgi:NADPH2:quinone reductase